MCLIAFAVQPAAPVPLLIAANRDEFWDRPTEPLAEWQTDTGHTVWAGRDVRAGGSWLGFSPQGRVAMLTNVRSAAPDAAPRSRGLLVTDWLTSTLPALQWLERHRPQEFGPFNLVLGDLARGFWLWVTNASVPPTPLSAAKPDLPPGWDGCVLGAGVYGLSNAWLDAPWPKTLQLKQAVQRWATQGPSANSTVLQALSSVQLAPAHALPRTGLPEELESILSSPFVYDPARRYGTRSTLLARLDTSLGTRQLHLQEWTHLLPQALLPDSTGWPMEQPAYSTLRRFSIPM